MELNYVYIPVKLCPELARRDVESSLYAYIAGKTGILPASEDSVPRRAQIQAPQGTKSSLDIRILFSLSHRAKPLLQHTAPPPRPNRSVYTVCCGRSCRAMTSMPMSLALPWPCWSSRTASMALTYVLAADIAVTQVTPRRTASVRSR